MFWYLAQLALFSFYATYVLRYSNEFTGPFVSSTKFVYNSKTSVSRPVNTFDYIRRVVYNPFAIQGDLWVEKPERLEGWDCPICLTFWVSLASSLGLYTLVGVFVNPIAVAGLVVLIFLALEKTYGVQLQETEDNRN